MVSLKSHNDYVNSRNKEYIDINNRQHLMSKHNSNKKEENKLLCKAYLNDNLNEIEYNKRKLLEFKQRDLDLDNQVIFNEADDKRKEQLLC